MAKIKVEIMEAPKKEVSMERWSAFLSGPPIY
jgi:hypothetical protein